MKKRGVLIALTNPVKGREDEFNEWYNTTHLPDVCKVPGIVGAKRYRLVIGPHVPGAKHWEYAAIYDIEAEDMNAIAQELGRRRGPTGKGTSEMYISSAIADERISWFYEDIFEYKPSK